jgi:hypothetical protein
MTASDSPFDLKPVTGRSGSSSYSPQNDTFYTGYELRNTHYSPLVRYDKLFYPVSHIMLGIEYFEHRLVITSAPQFVRAAFHREMRHLIFSVFALHLLASWAAIVGHRNFYRGYAVIFLDALQGYRRSRVLA